MKLSFICCFVIVQLIFTVCNCRASCCDGGADDKKMESKILSLLNKLPEVSGFLKLNKRDKPMLVIEREPDSAFKYYWVSVGVSNLGMYRTTTHFYINPKTFQIYYIDFMDWTGSGLVPLRQWRRLRNDSRFYSLHKIKAGKLIPTNEII
jgi:hypothetical protein